MTNIETAVAKRNRLQEELLVLGDALERDPKTGPVRTDAWNLKAAELLAAKAELAAARRAAPAPDVPMGRKVAEIETDMAPLRKTRAETTARLRALEAERSVAIVAEEIEKMPEARQKALTQVLGARGIESSVRLGIPGAVGKPGR